MRLLGRRRLLTSACPSRAPRSRPWPRILHAWLAAAAGCGAGAAEPTTDRAQLAPVAGVYALVDARGALADGGRSHIRLGAPARDAYPLYGWSVFPSAGASAPRPGGDLGRWARAGDRVEFRSDLGNGTYAATLVGVASGDANAVPGPTLTLPALGPGGGTYTFRRLRASGDHGAYLSVVVVDTAGALVAGGLATLTAPDGLETDAGFSGFQPFTTQGPPGEWTVAVTPAAGYALAPGQSNPTRVSVPTGSQPTTLRVRVVRATAP